MDRLWEYKLIPGKDSSIHTQLVTSVCPYYAIIRRLVESFAKADFDKNSFFSYLPLPHGCVNVNSVSRTLLQKLRQHKWFLHCFPQQFEMYELRNEIFWRGESFGHINMYLKEPEKQLNYSFPWISANIHYSKVSLSPEFMMVSVKYWLCSYWQVTRMCNLKSEIFLVGKCGNRKERPFNYASSLTSLFQIMQ